MDYGHTNNPQNFELDQLNLDTDEMFWEHGATPSHDSQAIGNKVISTPGNPDSSAQPQSSQPANAQPNQPNHPSQPNQYANLEMPPGVPTPENLSNSGVKIETLGNSPKNSRKTPSDADILNQALSVDLDAIKTEDQLDPRAVETVDKAIHQLDKDGNIANFYDTARDMMETNLKNSYNRKLAA